MTKFKAFSPDAEVSGDVVLAVVDGMGIFKNKAYNILAAHGIENPSQGKWYPQQALLDALAELNEAAGAKTLENIGKKIPSNALFPEDLKKLEEALEGIDAAYKMNHQGEIIGAYRFQKSGENEVKIVCCNPYPHSFNKGIILSLVEKFKPKGTIVKIELKEVDDSGDDLQDSDAFIIKW
jgi:hypothetical protein